MSIQKNVTGQKIVFLMVDATDFATPETGISVTAKYSRDGGGLSTCTNTVSEITSGLYVLTPLNSELNAGVVAFQLTGTGCADQWIIFYPEDGYAAGISDLISNLSNAISTLDGPITTRLSDIESAIDDGTYGLNALETITSQILSTIDGPVISDLSTIDSVVAAILTDTGTTLDDKIDSILSTVASVLVDTNTTLENRTISIVDLVSDILSTLDGPIISDLSSIESTVSYLEGAGGGDWGAKEKAQIRSALGISGATSALQAYGIKSELEGAITNFLTSIVDDSSKILSTLDGPIDSQLSTIVSTISYLEGAGGGDWGAKEKAQIRSALGISGALSALENYGTNSRLDNATYGLDALETIISEILSTLDGPITSDLSSIESTVSYLEGAGGGDWGAKEKAQIRSALGISGATSSLEAYGIKSELEGAITDFLTSIIDDTSKIHSTIDGPITSDLSNIESIVALLGGDSNSISSILEDTKSILSTLDGPIDSQLSDIRSAIANIGTGDSSGVTSALSKLNNATYGLDALETLISDVLSTIDGPVISDLSNIESIVASLGSDSDKITSILEDTASILSTLDGPILSTLDRNQTDLDAILTDTSSTLDNKIDSILEDTKEINSQCDSILADTKTLSNATYGLSAIENLVDSLESTLDGPIHSTLDKIDSTLDGAGVVQVDAVKISGSTTAADNLEASAETIVVAAAAAGTLSTTQMTTNLTEDTDDHYNGRIIIWTSGVLKDQATDITDYDGGSKLLTFTAVTEAPSDGDTFVIV